MPTPPELLAPAGNLEKLKTAVRYGAGAVYLGGESFSLRAHAGNFSSKELPEGVDHAHRHGVKVYATVNILAHNRDFNTLPAHLETLAAAGVDALIIADPGIVATAREVTPQIPIHLSTQANVTNTAAARFWQEQGVKRINTARELSLEEITAIRVETDLEIEVFVHGAICISYSGRCLLSSHMTGRSANRGDCAQPCRYNYRLVEEKRPGQYFPVEEDQRGSYIFNSRDLCLLNRLPELIEAGIHSLKIEGRMKSVFYTGSVVRVYRAALNHLRRHPGQPLPGYFMAEISKVGSRGYTENFLDEAPGAADMLYDIPHLAAAHQPAGIVRQGAPPLVEIRNPLWPGEIIDYLDQDLTPSRYLVKEIRDPEEDLVMEKANPGNLVHLTLTPPPHNWQPGTLLRKPVPS